MRKFIAAACVATVLVAAPATANTVEVPVKVDLSDLNLSNPADAAKAESRLSRLVRAACKGDDYFAKTKKLDRKCYETTKRMVKRELAKATGETVAARTDR